MVGTRRSWSPGLRRVAAVMILVSTLTVSSNEPAFAGTDIPDGTCAGTESCAFRNPGFVSNVADFNTCEPDWFCGIGNFALYDYWATNTSPNDRTSSIKNRTTRFSNYARNTFGGGQLICIPPGNTWPDLAALGFNDAASSMWNSTYNPCA